MPATAVATRPASDKSIAFLCRLFDERSLTASDRFFDATNAMDRDEVAAYVDHLVDKARASQDYCSRLIDALKELPMANGGQPRRESAAVHVTEPGVYETAEGVFVVKPNRDKTRLYAKRLIETGERVTEDGTIVNIDFEYAPGAIYRIMPADKMDVDRAKELTVRYGRCIVCNRQLKAAKSVEAGIGPHCRKMLVA